MALKRDRAAVRRPLGEGDRGDDVRALRKATIARAKHLKIPVPDWFSGSGALSKREVRYIGQIAIGMGAGANNRAAFARRRIPRNAQKLIRKTRLRTKRERKAGKRRAGYRQRLRKKYRAPLRVRAYRQAVQWIGVMEQGGNNVGPEVERIIAIGGGRRGDAWCGWFMAACYKIAGSQAVAWQWGAVRLMATVAGVIRTVTPLLGDILRFTFDHTGMFLFWVRWDGTKWARCSRAQATAVETIEGNTGATGAVSDSKTGGDGVYRKIRPLSLVSDYLRVTR